MTCGVYEIWCGPHFYQGSSKNIEVRVKSHLRDLRKGKHGNPKFQAVYNKYGWDTFAVLIECDEHSLARWEQQYLDANFGNENFINLNPEAYRPPHNPEWCAAHSARMKQSGQFPTFERTEEWRNKVSQAKKGNVHSEEAKAKLSAALKGRPKPPRTAEHRAKHSAAMKAKHQAKLEAKVTDVADLSLFREEN